MMSKKDKMWDRIVYSIQYLVYVQDKMRAGIAYYRIAYRCGEQFRGKYKGNCKMRIVRKENRIQKSESRMKKKEKERGS